MWGNQTRGPVRIVPAVPRKYERASTKPSVKDNNHQPTPQNSNSEQEKKKPSQGLDPTAKPFVAPTKSVQDFGLEKYGTLPPPFYPSNSSPTQPSLPSPIQPSLPSHHSSPLPQESEVRSDQSSTAEVEGAIPAGSYLPSNGYQNWATSESVYLGNPTPPNEEPSAPFQYSINAKTFHPQPTPPADITPPPSQSSQPQYIYPHISFYPPETAEFVDSPLSAASMYQGYSYVPASTDANFSTDLYAPLEPTNVQPNDKQDPLSEPSSRGGRSETTQSGDEVTTPPESLDSSQHDTARLPSLIHAVDSMALNRPYPDPVANDSRTEFTTDYNLWRRIALDDLRLVSREVWHEQMAMPAFFLQYFNKPQYADCRLRITMPDKVYEDVDLILHSILLAYSPTLATLFEESSERTPDGLRLIVLEATDDMITPAAIESALYTCYGRQLTDFIGTTTNVLVSNAHDSATWMQNALAFAAAGELLRLPNVVARGFQIASRILNWDNIEKALSFGVLDYASGSPESPPQDLNDQLSVDKTLIASCFRMIIDQFPKDWVLNVTARSLAAIDRLPVTISRKPNSTKKSQLSRIRFGDLPEPEPAPEPEPEPEKETETEEKQYATAADTLLSSIVISLPFKCLTHIQTRLEDRFPYKSLLALVVEREQRRLAILQYYPSFCQSTPSEDPTDTLGWQEYVARDMKAEGPTTRLSRRWVGYGLAKSG